MFSITKRNLKIFFRDKTTVFFSLLSVLIVIMLYVLFLGDVYTSNIESSFPEGSGVDVSALMMHWLMAGILALSAFTTTMGAYGIAVNDKANKISKDFYSTPLKRSSLLTGYIFSSFIIGVMMSVVSLFIFEFFLVMKGMSLLSFMVYLKVFGIILISVLCSSAFMLLILSFFKSPNAFSTAATVLGTLIGFMMGIYVPINQFPPAAQWIVKVFPPSHGAVLFRQVILESFTKNVPADQLSGFYNQMGVTYQFGNYTLSSFWSIMILLGSSLIFFAFALWNMSRKQKTF